MQTGLVSMVYPGRITVLYNILVYSVMVVSMLYYYILIGPNDSYVMEILVKLMCSVTSLKESAIHYTT